MNGTNYEVPHCGAFSTFPIVPNIRLNILFSNTLSLHSSLNVKDQAASCSTKDYVDTGNSF